jgi:nicotinamide-nucleotide amidase
VPEPKALADLVAGLAERGWTLATGESLTAGLVAATIAEVPGCSAVLRGGVVAYQADVKETVLGVPPDAIAAGLVSEAVAVALARGAMRTLQADVGIGTTGVAGPQPHDGAPVGSVWVAVATSDSVVTEHLSLVGDRAAIRCQTVEACLTLLGQVIDSP